MLFRVAVPEFSCSLNVSIADAVVLFLFYPFFYFQCCL
jgi:hypothetical protein